MRYWKSEDMVLCRGLLEENSRSKRSLSKKCTEEIKSGQFSSESEQYLKALSQQLMAIAGFEESLAESIFRIDKICHRYEEKITDYFELNIQKASPTVLGISTFENLKEHEGQMPFERRQK